MQNDQIDRRRHSLIVILHAVALYLIAFVVVVVVVVGRVMSQSHTRPLCQCFAMGVVGGREAESECVPRSSFRSNLALMRLLHSLTLFARLGGFGGCCLLVVP